MYKQLSAWLLRGLLLDYYNEFFIMIEPTSTAVATTSAEQSDSEESKSEEKVLHVSIALSCLTL